MPPSHARPDAPNDAAPAPTRSRVGDFFFAGVAGGFTLLGAVMVGGLALLPALLLGAVYAGALTLRYAALREATPVAPAVSFNEEQVQRFERLRAVLNALPQPVMLLDAEDKVEMSNPAAQAAFGMRVTGRHVSALVRAPAALDALATARRTGLPQEAEFALADQAGGAARHGLFYAAAVGPIGSPLAPDRGRVLVMVRDRTAQRKLERMRSDFIANASHELRTPLTAMLGFIETLETHARDDEAARARFLGIMRAQSERMLRLVRDLVSLSAIELREAAPPTETVDLTEVASGICEMLEPLASAQHGGRCECLEAAPVLVAADRDEVAQVVQNLADNALRYGGASPAVEILTGHGQPAPREGAVRTGDTAQGVAARLGCAPGAVGYVQVRDQGEGIARSDLPRLTERFYRIDAEKSRKVGGTGLGLAIVKHIVQHHRGGLQIESREGEGASFTCFFPPPRPPRAAPHDTAASERVAERTERA